jgi:hypothetical protein
VDTSPGVSTTKKIKYLRPAGQHLEVVANGFGSVVAIDLTFQVLVEGEVLGESMF